jgi:hypothetical protein
MENEKLKKVNEGIVSLKSRIKALEAEGATKDEQIKELGLIVGIAKNLLLAERSPAIAEKFEEVLVAIDAFTKKEAPTEFSVNNLKEVTDKLQAIFDKEQMPYPTEIKVSNLGEIKGEKEVKVSNFAVMGKLFTTGLTGVVKAIQGIGSKAFNAVVTGEVRITNKEIQDAIPVRLASKDLRFFYDAMTTVMGSGGGSTDVGLLQQIIDAIEALGGTWYDNIGVTYPDVDEEVYTYKLGLVTVQTITVVYTDATKVDLLSVTKT